MTTLLAWSFYQYDLKGRLTEIENSEDLFKEFLYIVRSEVRSASIGDITYSYTYDTIGNRLSDSIGSVIQTYVPDSLNHISTRGQETFTYDPDGNLLSDGTYSYTYDCENRLLSVTPINLQYGSLRLLNQYGYKHRRIQKTVETYNNGWHPLRTHTFLYEDWNFILELIQHANNTTTTIEYFWGNDLSGSEQGAGGVGGLIAVSIDGTFYFPTYDNNGNITDYLSESGTFISQVTYTPFGTSTAPVTIPPHLNFHFSTKYLDRETGLYYYGYRFYLPEIERWLNRDPLEEEESSNLYSFVQNDGVNWVDDSGLRRTRRDRRRRRDRRGDRKKGNFAGVNRSIFKFYLGGNKAANIKKWGYLSHYRSSLDVKQFECEVRNKARESIDDRCAKEGTEWKGSYSRLVDATDGLFIMGNGVPKATWICTKKSGHIICRISYQINDSFEDPIDLDTHFNRKLPGFMPKLPDSVVNLGGHPYRLTANWGDTIDGESALEECPLGYGDCTK